MRWTVEIHRRVEKQIPRLPRPVQETLFTLVRDIEAQGPVRDNWRHYGKLGENRHHCHLKGGHPTYVAVWEVIDATIRLVEITYAGTHENAPY